jgi:hypothetical protein
LPSRGPAAVWSGVPGSLPHARSEKVRPGRRLPVEATFQLRSAWLTARISRRRRATGARYRPGVPRHGRAGWRVPVVAVMRERAVVLRTGEDRGSGWPSAKTLERRCTPPPKKLPRAQIHPEKARRPGTRERAGTGGVNGPGRNGSHQRFWGLVGTGKTRPGARRGQSLRPYINVAHLTSATGAVITCASIVSACALAAVLVPAIRHASAPTHTSPS